MIDYKKANSGIAYLINMALILIYSGVFSNNVVYKTKILPYFININSIIMFLGIAVLIINYKNDEHKMIIYNKGILIFLVTIFITSKIALNGKEMDISFDMLVALVFYTMIIAEYFSVKYILELLIQAQFIINFYTIYEVITNPTQAKTQYLNQVIWQGGFSHKNALAAMMCFGIILSFSYLISDLKNKKIKNQYIIILICMSLFILLKSGSKTSLITTVIALATIILYKNEKIKRNISTILLIGDFIFFLAITSENPLIKMITNLVSRDITLTGRTKIWPGVIDIIKESPLIGYGYVSFWGNYPDLSAYIWQSAGFISAGSHNNFLEWLLLTGIVGLIVLLINIIRFGEKNKKINNDAIRYLGLGYITFLLIYSMTERVTDPLDFKVFMLFLILALTNKLYIQKKRRG